MPGRAVRCRSRAGQHSCSRRLDAELLTVCECLASMVRRLPECPQLVAREAHRNDEDAGCCLRDDLADAKSYEEVQPEFVDSKGSQRHNEEARALTAEVASLAPERPR